MFYLGFTMFKLILFVSLWLIPLYCSANDCLREIKVKEILVRSNPSLLHKIKDKIKDGETKMVFISCDLYKTVKVGDELQAPGDPVDRIRLFSKDNGVIERKRYIVLSK